MWADHMPDFVLFALESCLPKDLDNSLLHSNSDEIFSTPIATPTPTRKNPETSGEVVKESSFLRMSVESGGESRQETGDQ